MKLPSFLTRPLSIRAVLQSWLGVPISLQDGTFWREWAGSGNFTGTAVNVDNALKLATVWACVRLISETIATLPLGFYRRNADGSRTAATGHNLYEILHNQPNADMTAVAFWEVVVASMLLWGNAYIEINRRANFITSLSFLLPYRVTLKRLKDGSLEYRYRGDASTERVIPADRMMHIPAFSLDGIVGLSPIAYGANVIGTSIDTDKASAETFRDAMRAPGIITTKRLLSNPQREQHRAHLKKVNDEGGVYIFEEGTGFEKLKFNPVDAELLESRSWNVGELCRLYGVDPAMIGHGGKDSNWGTGLEEKAGWLMTFTLRKWCVRIEQAVRRSCLTATERMTLFAEFTLEGLLRGDAASRASFYSTMTQNGIYTRDECRQKENLPPMGGNAAVLTIQSNMAPIDALGQQTPADNNARNALMAWLGIESAGTPAKE